jgi:UDP-glucose 4-epimerase
MKILITGGLGYIGGRLAQYLVTNTSNKVILGTRKDITSVGWLPEAQVVQMQWNSSEELDKACKGVDLVIHCAGMNSMDCQKNPLLALDVNGYGTSKIIQSSINQGVRRFIYISSAHVYSSVLTGKITEKTSINNLHPYASSHKIGEEAVTFAHTRGEIEGVVIRLTNSFGAPSSKDASCWSLVLNDLCRQSFKNKKMILTIREMQRRDFISLTNVCRAIEHLSILSLTKLGNGIFNVGGEWSPTILNIAELLSERLWHLYGVKINPETPNLISTKDIKGLNFDITKLKLTDFKIIHNQNIELDNLIHYCNKHFLVDMM